MNNGWNTYEITFAGMVNSRDGFALLTCVVVSIVILLLAALRLCEKKFACKVAKAQFIILSEALLPVHLTARGIWQQFCVQYYSLFPVTYR